MTIILSENFDLANSCMEVARAFSAADLKARPETNTVMSFFSENAVFSGRYFGGKYP